jgi:hypothetical protein
VHIACTDEVQQPISNPSLICPPHARFWTSIKHCTDSSWLFFSFHIRQPKYSTCLSVCGLFHLTSCPSVPSICCKLGDFILHVWMILHCVYITNLLYQFIWWWAPRWTL